MSDETIDPASEQEIVAGEHQPVHEFRTLGYGHRAYQPDPHAQYSFRSWVIRPLPVDPQRRWR